MDFTPKVCNLWWEDVCLVVLVLCFGLKQFEVSCVQISGLRVHGLGYEAWSSVLKVRRFGVSGFRVAARSRFWGFGEGIALCRIIAVVIFNEWLPLCSAV